MKTHEIRYAATLDYCDGVQLFVAEDAVDNNYVAALTSVGGAADQYLVVGCEPENLLMFHAGATDLKNLMQQSAEQGWYIADIASFGEPFLITQQEGTSIPDELLPVAGFYLDGNNVDRYQETEYAILD